MLPFHGCSSEAEADARHGRSLLVPSDRLDGTVGDALAREAVPQLPPRGSAVRSISPREPDEIAGRPAYSDGMTLSEADVLTIRCGARRPEVDRG